MCKTCSASPDCPLATFLNSHLHVSSHAVPCSQTTFPRTGHPHWTRTSEHADPAIYWAWLSSAQPSTAYQGVLQLRASWIANGFAFLCWKCLACCEHWQSQNISRLIRHPVAHSQHYSLKLRSWENVLAADPWLVTLSLWWNMWESNQPSRPDEALSLTAKSTSLRESTRISAASWCGKMHPVSISSRIT